MDDSPPPPAPFDALSRVLARIGLAAAALFVLALATTRLSSVDLGYHLAYGRYFLDNGKIVDIDPFIYGATGYRFVNANWGSQALLAWVERHAGLAALVPLTTLLVGLIFAGVGWLAWRRCPRVEVVALILIAVALAAYERFSLRPELLSYLFLMGAALLAADPPQRRGLGVALAALLQIVWVNAHGYFLVAPLLSAASLAGRAGQLRRAAPRDAACRTLALMLAVQLAASLVNPRGLAGVRFPLDTLELLRTQRVSAGGPDRPLPGGPWSAISEFHGPLNYLGYPIAGRPITAYVGLLALAAPGVLAAWRMRRGGDALMVLLLAMMSLSMRRNVAQFALVAGPLSIGALAAWLGGAPWSSVARRRAALGASLAALALCGYWVPRVVSGRFYVDERRVGRRFGFGVDPAVIPIDACAFLNTVNRLQPRLFADFFTASNVLPLLGRQVFIHTNTFAYPPAALATMQEVSTGVRPHTPFFAEQGVNVVLLHVGAESRPLVAALAADAEWALVFVDRAFVVFVRRIPQHEGLIAVRTQIPAALPIDEWLAAAREGGPVAGFDLAAAAGVPLALGWYEPAARLLDRAVTCDPNSVEAWLNLGVCHAEFAKAAARRTDAVAFSRALEQAERCFRRVLELDPGHAAARQNLEPVTRARAALR